MVLSDIHRSKLTDKMHQRWTEKESRCGTYCKKKYIGAVLKCVYDTCVSFFKNIGRKLILLWYINEHDVADSVKITDIQLLC